MSARVYVCIALLLFCGSTGYGAGSSKTRSLSLARCYELAREHNAEFHATIQNIEETRGDDIVARSRLLPHLSALYRGGWRADNAAPGVSDELAHARGQDFSLELRQRLIEFGKTTPGELDRLRAKQDALYRHENKTVGMISAIRRTYFALRIIQDQLHQHDTLLAAYTAQLENARERLDKGVTLKTAVLAARLNRLEEQERILGLREKRRLRIAEMSELLGVSALADSFTLTDTMTMVSISEDSCVALALHRSTEVSDAEHEAALSKRQLHEWGWEFAPNVSFSAGVQRESHELGFEMGGGAGDGAARQWALDLVGAERLITPEDTMLDAERLHGSALFPVRDSSWRYTLKVMVRFPIFSGLERRGTRVAAAARYEYARKRAIAATREAEKKTRQAFARYRLSRDILAVRRERVEIDRERYTLALVQHDLGRMSDEGLDSFRERLFRSQDSYFAQQFQVLESMEDLRALIRIMK